MNKDNRNSFVTFLQGSVEVIAMFNLRCYTLNLCLINDFVNILFH